MQLIVSIILFGLPVFIALFSSHFFFVFVLGSGGLPTGFLMEQRSALSFFGGIGPGPIKQLGLIVGSFIILAFSAQKWAKFLPVLIPYILFIFFCTLSLLWCPNFIYGFRMLAKLTTPLFILIALFSITVSSSRMKTYEKAIFFSCVVLALLAILNYFTGFARKGSTHLISEGLRSLEGPYMHRAVLAFHLSCGGILALSNYITERKKIYLLIFGLLTICIFWSFQRIAIAGYIAASSLCIFMLVKSKMGRLMIPILICMAIFTAFFTVSALKSRNFSNPDSVTISGAFSNPEGLLKRLKTSGRSSVWGVALEKFYNKNKLIGAGLGATQNWFYGGYEKQMGVLHSEYLRLLCELGAFGLSLFIITMVFYLTRLAVIYTRAKYKKESHFARKYSAIALSSLLFYLITLSTDNSFDYVMQLNVYVFTYTGLAFIADNLKGA